jgi:hypothetical protein
MAKVRICEAIMEEQAYPTLNTREFIAKWDSAVEEHLAAELADLLRQLMADDSSAGDLEKERFAALARHLAHALHMAGTGGVQAALEYLHQVALIPDHSESPATSNS